MISCLDTERQVASDHVLVLAVVQSCLGLNQISADNKVLFTGLLPLNGNLMCVLFSGLKWNNRVTDLLSTIVGLRRHGQSNLLPFGGLPGNEFGDVGHGQIPSSFLTKCQ